MITSTIIFSTKVHLNIIKYLKKIFYISSKNKILTTYETKILYIFIFIFINPILFPFRYLLYGLCWNEKVTDFHGE